MSKTVWIVTFWAAFENSVIEGVFEHEVDALGFVATCTDGEGVTSYDACYGYDAREWEVL